MDTSAPRCQRPDMRWLGKHIGDNRYVGALFAVLIVVNAFAIQAGYYR
jgi:hypothetical protein